MAGKGLKRTRSVPNVWVLGLFVILILAFLILWPLVGIKVSAIVVAGVHWIALGAFFFRKRDPASVCTDERERVVNDKAAHVAGVVPLAACAVGPVVLYLMLMRRGEDVLQIKTQTLLYVGWGMVMLYSVSFAIAYLILWFGGIRHGKD